jgi:hypothetical protein
LFSAGAPTLGSEEFLDRVKQPLVTVRQQVVEALGLQTASGQIKVRWDTNGQATAQGQMAFFIEFVNVTGLFDRSARDCPLNHTSPNGSTPRDKKKTGARNRKMTVCARREKRGKEENSFFTGNVCAS